MVSLWAAGTITDTQNNIFPKIHCQVWGMSEKSISSSGISANSSIVKGFS